MVLPSVLYSLENGLLKHMGMAHAGPEPEAAVKSSDSRDRRQTRLYETFGNVAVIHIDGVIDKHISDFEMSCYGGYDIDDLDQALNRAGNDPRIERVVLNINSPGGSVSGVPETAARVARLAESKEVHAYVDVLAASAAYYIASQADVIVAARSAVLGSIGVYCTLVDATRAAEIEGYKIEIIKAGKFKAMGHAFKPLTDEERAMIQANVDGIHAAFRANVNAMRPQVTLDSMEGQCFTGQAALDAGLADMLTDYSLDEYIASLLVA